MDSDSNRAAPGGDNSKHHLSMLYHKKTAEQLVGLQRLYRWVIIAWVPIALVVVGMSSLWADILGKAGSYSVTENWQACLVQADYQYIPISEIAQYQVSTQGAITKTNFKNCLIGLVFSGQCTVPCLQAINGTCPLPPPSLKVNDPALPTGKFLGGLSYIGIQAIIFSAGGHASMRRALVHPSWIPSTIALLVWFLYGIFNYYTVSPVLPVPGQTNSSFLMYIYYESSGYKFDNFNGGDNHCDKANVYVWVYILFVILLASTILIALIIGIYAERIRYKALKKHYEPLRHTEIPCILAVIAVIFYWLLTVSKITSSLNILNAINNFTLTTMQAAKQGLTIWFPQIWFPFAQPFFDLSTILGIMSLMSIVRGYTIQSISAFRLSFIAALVFTVTTYPGIVGAFEFYNYHTFSNDDDCQNFFQMKSKKLFFVFFVLFSFTYLLLSLYDYS
jgi:hypothetical protein